MPTVPRRSNGYVPTTPTRPVQPGSAFLPPAPVDIAPASKEIASLVEEHAQKADQVAVLAANNQLFDIASTLETQTLSRKGLDAMSAGPEVETAWRKATSNISVGLTNERQKEAFQTQADRHWLDLSATVKRHGVAEYQKFDAANTDSALSNRLDNAVKHFSDPSVVSRSLAESKYLVSLYGERNGWSPEQVQERQTDAASKIHSGVIDQMLNGGQDLTAQAYFTAHRDELNATDSLQIGKALDIGSLRGESQRQADTIVSQAATLGGALRETQKITDPKLREATEERVRRHFEDASASDRFERQQAYQQASAILAQTPDLHAIPPSMMQKLSASKQIELQHLVAQKRNPERATNWNTYSKLLNMAGLNDSTRQQFEQLDLTKYRGDLSDQHYEHLLTLQLGERRQTGGALSTEAKRQATASARDAAKAAQRAQAAEMLRSMGVDIPAPPRAPGAPLRGPTTQLRLSPKGKQVPQTWIDKASKDENYKRYLQHMGVVFDSAFSSPTVRTGGNSTGDIILK